MHLSFIGMPMIAQKIVLNAQYNGQKHIHLLLKRGHTNIFNEYKKIYKYLIMHI